MLGLLQFLINREAKPLAYAAAEAIARPTRKAVGRVIWSLGFAVGALVLAISAIGVGAVGLTGYLLESLPAAQAVLAWSAGSLAIVAVVCALLAMVFAKAISPKRLMREGQDTFVNERHRQDRTRNSSGAKGTQDPLVSSYAFARGFADGLKY